jgi:hypothetical protein
VESACCDALDSLSCFVHGDATVMELASHFVGGKGDVPDYIQSRWTGFGSPGTAGMALS